MTMRTDDTPRPELDETFFAIAKIMAERSTCPAGARHGAVAVIEGRIVSTGYGSPATGVAPCEKCWLREYRQETSVKDWTKCPAVHAEANIICHAARHGVSIRGATVYITREPCEGCKRLMKNAGIRDWVTPGARKVGL